MTFELSVVCIDGKVIALVETSELTKLDNYTTVGKDNCPDECKEAFERIMRFANSLTNHLGVLK
jgi:hypothetical protein